MGPKFVQPCSRHERETRDRQRWPQRWGHTARIRRTDRCIDKLCRFCTASLEFPIFLPLSLAFHPISFSPLFSDASSFYRLPLPMRLVSTLVRQSALPCLWCPAIRCPLGLSSLTALSKSLLKPFPIFFPPLRIDWAEGGAPDSCRLSKNHKGINSLEAQFALMNQLRWIDIHFNVECCFNK